MIHLRSISFKPPVGKSTDFPFNLPLLKGLKEIVLHKPVTFFVGENGTGKSTLLEAIAAGIGSIAVGAEDIEQDSTLGHANRLGKHLKFVWQQKTRRGFFLRAEDFFNFAKRVNQMSRELEQIAKDFEQELSGHALALAQAAANGQRRELMEKYGADADARSHGESFINLFKERFVPGGLYLLDEPEAPLSPQRQLALLSLLKEMVEQRGQFIIATHSPIIMAYPEAEILSFDGKTVQKVNYDDLEHVSLTKAFLNNPESFLRRL